MYPVACSVLTSSDLCRVDPSELSLISGAFASPILSDDQLSARLFGFGLPVRAYEMIRESENWMEDAESARGPSVIFNVCISTYRQVRLAQSGYHFVPWGVSLGMSAVYAAERWTKTDFVEEMVHRANTDGLSVLAVNDEIGPQKIAEATLVGKAMDTLSAFPMLSGRRPVTRESVFLRNNRDVPLIARLFRASGLTPLVASDGADIWAPLGMYVNDRDIASRLMRLFMRQSRQLQRDPLIQELAKRRLLTQTVPDDLPDSCLALLGDR